jgi:hypothetical protein
MQAVEAARNRIMASIRGQRSTSVAFGAKRTVTEPYWHCEWPGATVKNLGSRPLAARVAQSDFVRRDLDFSEK